MSDISEEELELHLAGFLASKDRWIKERDDLRRQLEAAMTLAEEYHNQADCYTTAWKQRAEKAEAELAKAKALEGKMLDALDDIGKVNFNADHAVTCTCMQCWTWARATKETEGVSDGTKA